MSAVAGAAAGILGLTGLYGFVFYFVTAFFLSVSMGFEWSFIFYYLINELKF